MTLYVFYLVIFSYVVFLHWALKVPSLLRYPQRICRVGY